jgi:hypothetical protein
MCQRARRKAFSNNNILSAFAEAGIHPFRRRKVLDLVESVTLEQEQFVGLQNHNPKVLLASKKKVMATKDIEELRDWALQLMSGMDGALTRATMSRARPGHRKRPAYEGRVIFGEPGRQQLHHGPGL